MRAMLFCVLLAMPLHASAQWQVRENGLPASWPFQTVALADSTSAWVSGGGKIWHSTDLGKTWTLITIPDPWVFGFPGAMSAPSRTTMIYGSARGYIFRTSDSGVHWSQAFGDSTVTSFINDIAMFDSLRGMAIGDPPDSTRHPGLLMTSDAGATWQIVTNDLPAGDIQFRGRTSFVRPDLAWSQVMNDGIYRSTNGGRNWHRIFSSTAPEVIFFLNDSVGFFATYSPPTGLMKTTDGGLTWSEKIVAPPPVWVKWAPRGKLLWSARDTLYKSTDAGETWERVMTAKAMGGCNSFTDAAFVADDLGLVVGICLVIGMSPDPTPVPGNPENKASTFALMQSYPNPFNPSASIRYTLPRRMHVTLLVYNALGQVLATLADTEEQAGEHAVKFDGSNLASGVYFYRLKAGSLVKTMKFLLVR